MLLKSFFVFRIWMYTVAIPHVINLLNPFIIVQSVDSPNKVLEKVTIIVPTLHSCSALRPIAVSNSLEKQVEFANISEASSQENLRKSPSRQCNSGIFLNPSNTAEFVLNISGKVSE